MCFVMRLLLLIVPAVCTALVVTSPWRSLVPHTDADFGGKPEVSESTLVLAEPSDGCSRLRNNVEGKLVLVIRGNCRFDTKALVAQEARASAVVVMDDSTKEHPWQIRMQCHACHTIHIPSVFIPHASGKELMTTLRTSNVSVVLNSTGQIPADKNRGYTLHGIDPSMVEIVSAAFSGLIHAALPYMGYVYASSFFFVLMSFYCALVDAMALYWKQYGRRSLWQNLAVTPYAATASERVSCTICLDEFSSNEMIKVLPCRHIYHRECIDEWFENGNNTCPMCKRKAFR
ncbi:hypothetical protein AeRB84_004775 [Aphanomyces euteiches]|nr:hypothetical protein AeRB84_004775 [Aphanomyces euteiches]